MKYFVKLLNSFPGCLSRLANHRLLSVCIVGMVPLIGRLLLLPLLHIPLPGEAIDEFAYLLAAKTFAMGRMTNPTPPMWVHFETFFQVMQPTYMSIYPLGQSVLLALGIIFFGHPWWAVWLSVGVMCGLLTWMLQGWMPPRWALLGGLLAALQFGFTHYWMNTYWGGSLAAIGGCLVLGALPRLKEKLRISHALAFAFGLMILANTRPFEGFVLAAVAGAILIQWLARQKNAEFYRRFFLRAVLPSLAVIVPIACLMMAENKAVTGSPFTFPHESYRRNMAVVQTFVWEKARPPPVYNHEKFRKFFVDWEPGNAAKWGTLSGLLPGLRDRLWGMGSSFFPNALYLPLALASFAALFSRRIRWLGIATLAGLAASLLPRWTFAHYLAPILCALMAIHLQFFRHLRVWNWNGKRIGAALYAGILCLLVVFFVGRIYNRSVHPSQPWAPMRETIRKQLEATPGKHLIFVRYSDDHPPVDEWVYNEPDIPAAKIVWARSMNLELDRDLEQYFDDRSAWDLEVDANPPALRRR